MFHKHREILNNRNAIFSLCEASCEAQFKPDVTSFFVGWCIYENFRSLLPRPWMCTATAGDWNDVNLGIAAWLRKAGSDLDGLRLRSRPRKRKEAMSLMRIALKIWLPSPAVAVHIKLVTWYQFLPFPFSLLRASFGKLRFPEIFRFVQPKTEVAVVSGQYI